MNKTLESNNITKFHTKIMNKVQNRSFGHKLWVEQIGFHAKTKYGVLFKLEDIFE